MDANVRQHLLAAGINVDTALERFLRNSALWEKYLRRFPDDPNYALLCQAMEQGDMEAAFTAAHTLKGVAGNLSLDALFAATSTVVESLRRRDLSAAREQMLPLQHAYGQVLDALSAWR